MNSAPLWYCMWQFDTRNIWQICGQEVWIKNRTLNYFHYLTRSIINIFWYVGQIHEFYHWISPEEREYKIGFHTGIHRYYHSLPQVDFHNKRNPLARKPLTMRMKLLVTRYFTHKIHWHWYFFSSNYIMNIYFWPTQTNKFNFSFLIIAIL